MRSVLSLLLFVPFALAETLQTTPGEQVPTEDSQVANFHVVDLGRPALKLFRSASPVRPFVDDPDARAKAAAVMGHLKELGVRTIVSFEDPTDTKKDGRVTRSVTLEEEAARGAAIAFVNKPLRNGDLRTMTQARTTAWLEGAKKAVLAGAKKGGVLYHCAAGHDRTGILTAYLRVTQQGWTAERAIIEMRRYGHDWKEFSSNGGLSSWHEDYLRARFGAPQPVPATTR